MAKAPRPAAATPSSCTDNSDAELEVICGGALLGIEVELLGVEVELLRVLRRPPMGPKGGDVLSVAFFAS
jgi:hypothetical protein